MVARLLHLSLVVAVFVSVLSLGCADRDRITEPPPSQDLDAEVIGSTGGVLETEGFRFIVPPGAFAQDASLVLRDSTDTAPADEHRISRVFHVGGLPETIARPCSIQVRVPTPDSEQGERFVIVEETDTFISSAARFDRCPITLDCETGGDLVWALLPETPPAGMSPDVRETATGAVKISVVGNQWSYVTPEQHFQILYGWMQLQAAAEDVGTQLEDAYALLRDDLGLSWSKRSRRITVRIQAFSEEDKEKWGLHVASKWHGAEYDEILLNKALISANPGSDDLKATLGHELFHLMQHLYDPRTRIMQGMPNDWFWMNEAMSTWFERKMVGKTYVPASVRDTDYRFHLAHALQYTPDYSLGVICSDCWIVQNHGYGASLFLGNAFEGFAGGERKIGEVLSLRLQETGPIGALVQVLASYTAGLDAMWRGFCSRWMDGAIYEDVPSFPSPSKIVEGRSDAFTFSAVDQSVHTFQWQSRDYSGHLYMVYFNQSAGIPENAAASISYVDEEGGSELIVYQYKKDASWQRFGSLGEPGRTITVSGVAEWAREGKGLAILVFRTYASQSGFVPVAVQIGIDRCDPALPVVLNGTTIAESKVTRNLAGCVTKIDLSWMSLTDPGCLDGIDQYATALEEVTLLHNTLPGIDLSDLGKCLNLKSLDLRYAGLQSVDLSPLRTCTNLESLDLAGNQLQSVELSPLSTCTKLRAFHLRDNQVVGLNLTPLAVGDSLRTLILSNNYLDGIDLTPLGSMPNLTTLEMNGCDLGSVNLAPLANCPNLNFLAMGENRIAVLDLAPLANHVELEILGFNANGISQVDLTPLASCSALRSLNFINCTLTSINLTPLEGLAALRWLELEQNYLDGESCGRICTFKADHPGCSVTSDCGCMK